MLSVILRVKESVLVSIWLFICVQKNILNRTLAVDSPSQTLALGGHPKFTNKEAKPLKNEPNSFKRNQEIKLKKLCGSMIGLFFMIFLKFVKSHLLLTYRLL